MPIHIDLGNDDDLWSQLPPCPEGRPLDVLILGLPGSGKTTRAKHLVASAIREESIQLREMMLTSHTVVATNRLVREIALHCEDKDTRYPNNGVKRLLLNMGDRTAATLLEEVGDIETSDSYRRPTSDRVGTTIAIKRRNMDGAKTVDTEALGLLADRMCGVLRDSGLIDEAFESEDYSKDVTEVTQFVDGLINNHDQPGSTSYKATDGALEIVKACITIAQRGVMLGVSPAEMATEEYMAYQRRKRQVPQTRARLIPPAEVVVSVYEIYRDTLADLGVTDFVSILQAPLIPLNIKMAIFDEAQDYNHLILHNARMLSANARYRFWIGDHNQAIYSRWAGGDSHLFSDMQNQVDVVAVLTQCNRIGYPAFSLLERYHERINPLQDVNFRARPKWETKLSHFEDEAQVTLADVTNESQRPGDVPVNDMMVIMRADAMGGGRRKWQKWCDVNGRAYHTIGDLGLTCFNWAERRHALTLWKLHTPQTGADGASYPRNVGRREVVTLLRRLNLPHDMPMAADYQLQDLPQLPTLEQSGLQEDHLRYMLHIRQTYGTLDIEELKQTPGAIVRIGTIHSSKGEEADTVVLDCRFRKAKCVEQHEIDEEWRVWLVAVTRARRHLVIIEGTKIQHRLPTDKV